MGRTGRLEPGARVAGRKLEGIDGEVVAVPDPDRLVHLQFRRFAGCPVCNLHLRSIASRHEELEAAGVREVAVFHSSAESLRSAIDAPFPFALVGDPDKRLYREFGVESSPRSVLDPKAWSAELRGLWTSRRKLTSINLRGGPLGLPADFLIAADGRIVASHYGSHADDQWSVDEILAVARSAEHT